VDPGGVAIRFWYQFPAFETPPSLSLMFVHGEEAITKQLLASPSAGAGWAATRICVPDTWLDRGMALSFVATDTSGATCGVPMAPEEFDIDDIEVAIDPSCRFQPR